MQTRRLQQFFCSAAAGAVHAIPPRFSPQMDASERHKAARYVPVWDVFSVADSGSGAFLHSGSRIIYFQIPDPQHNYKFI
jgi:hypothetical protein